MRLDHSEGGSVIAIGMIALTAIPGLRTRYWGDNVPQGPQLGLPFPVCTASGWCVDPTSNPKNGFKVGGPHGWTGVPGGAKPLSASPGMRV